VAGRPMDDLAVGPAERALLDALRRGDENAFARVVGEHHASLRRVARLYVANAAIAILRAQDWQAQVRHIEKGLRAGLEPLRGAAGVTDVRVLGAIGVVQLDHAVDVAAATAAAVAAGVWLRPFRDLIYTMPPYVADDADVARITQGIVAAVSAT